MLAKTFVLLLVLPGIVSQNICRDENDAAMDVFNGNCAQVCEGTNNGQSLDLSRKAHLWALCPQSCNQCRQCVDNNQVTVLLLGFPCDFAAQRGICVGHSDSIIVQHYCPVACGTGCPHIRQDCYNRDSTLMAYHETYLSCDQVEIDQQCHDLVLSSACPRHCGMCPEIGGCQDHSGLFFSRFEKTCLTDPLHECSDPLLGLDNRLYCPETCGCCDNSTLLGIVSESDMTCEDAREDPQLCNDPETAIFFQPICKTTCDSCSGQYCGNHPTLGENCEASNIGLCGDLPWFYQFYCSGLCQNPTSCEFAGIPTPTPTPDPEQTCVDHDDGIINIAHENGFTWVDSCASVGAFCRDDTYGAVVTDFCPVTCGQCSYQGGCAYDNDYWISALARQAGIYDVNNCENALTYVPQCSGIYSTYMWDFCPCTCSRFV